MGRVGLEGQTLAGVETCQVYKEVGKVLNTHTEQLVPVLLSGRLDVLTNVQQHGEMISSAPDP